MTVPMQREAVRAGVLEAIREVAPELDPAGLADDRPLRRQVELDSMDWLRVIVGWHQRFGVDIPEADYARLHCVAAIVDYLVERLEPAPS
jgi:acyl carrier protein